MGIAIMSTDLDKLHVVCQKTYKEQAVWFLNCFWEEFADKEAELIWQYVLKNAELDLENHETGSGLDEMKAHVFLERFDETLTVREMRAKLRSTGAIGESERPKLVPLMHYLLYKYNADWHTLVDETRQGDNKEELEKAEQMLKEVQQAFQESERAASAARKALLEAQSKEADAKAREAEAVARENEAVQRENEAVQREKEAVERENAAKASEQQAKQREAAAKASAEESRKIEEQAKKDAVAAKQAEVDAQAAQKELEAALAELKKEEDAFNAKKSELERKGNDESIGLVTRNKAKNELAQLLAEDPLPLKRAKITQEAAVRKAEKATAHAAQTRQASEASASSASKARAQAEQDAAQAESARKSAEADAAAASAARESASQARQSASQAREAAASARQAASQARQQAEAARAASEKASAAAEAALDEAARRLSEAETYLEEVKSKPGQSYGALWWIDRELHEQKKYLPVSRGGIAK